ncbi:hypothetical protein HY11_01485 [Hyphomonas pacifica]|nr:hypothetical protein HY11_01485 [Hyphomonas pacifica]
MLDLRANWETISRMTDAPQFLDTSAHFQSAQDASQLASAPIRYKDPFTLHFPEKMHGPVIFTSPHSGNVYPESMKSALCVPLETVRRTEDAFVEQLFEDAHAHGAILMAARYARSVTDLNRDPRELDPTMFHDGVPRACGAPTARVEAGLGCLPRVASQGEEIYGQRMSRAEGAARLTDIHDAYHQRLSLELATLKEIHGRVILIDCHSMPSVQPGRRHLADIVLGDRFGSSCDPRLTGRVERAFRAQGLTVARNAPYAGGYTTRRYGRPKRNVHALQIEINRGLYMDEGNVSPLGTFDSMRAAVSTVIQEIVSASGHIPVR